MGSREERRAELEAQLAELDAEDEDPGIEAVDIQDGTKSVRFTGKGSVQQAKRWLAANFADLFDPDPETPESGGADDDGPKGEGTVKAFGRTIRKSG
jgi:hypothetical protein